MADGGSHRNRVGGGAERRQSHDGGAERHQNHDGGAERHQHHDGDYRVRQLPVLNGAENNHYNPGSPRRMMNDQEWEDGDAFSFEDSERFEEDSLCSWLSEPESLNNNWTGWANQKDDIVSSSVGACLPASLTYNGGIGSMGYVGGAGDAATAAVKKWRISCLVELCAQTVARQIPFEVVEHFVPPIPENLQIRIAFWSFPENEADIRLYSCLANGNVDEFHKGEQLLRANAVKDLLQIGFHLSARVEIPLPNTTRPMGTVVTTSTAATGHVASSASPKIGGNPSLPGTLGTASSVAPAHQAPPANCHDVAITLDRCHITSVSCSCGTIASWCSHIVAVCLHRINNKESVSLRAPVSESLSGLERDQLQKFAQYLINELPHTILPTAQKLLDELLDSKRESVINQLPGAPDPTAGASIHDETNWCLDESTLHENIRKILIKFCIPSPTVLSDVNYLTSTAPPAAAEWLSVLQALVGRLPEGLWNLLAIVREMYKRQDTNATHLLHIISQECLASEQVLAWWYNTKFSQTLYGNQMIGGYKIGLGNSVTAQYSCAFLCDEIVALWRLAALNPALTPEQRSVLEAQLKEYHLKAIEIIDKLVSSISNNSSDDNHRSTGGLTSGVKVGKLSPEVCRFDFEAFPGFKQAVEGCRLSWEDFLLDGSLWCKRRSPFDMRFVFYEQCFVRTELQLATSTLPNHSPQPSMTSSSAATIVANMNGAISPLSHGSTSPNLPVLRDRGKTLQVRSVLGGLGASSMGTIGCSMNRTNLQHHTFNGAGYTSGFGANGGGCAVSPLALSTTLSTAAGAGVGNSLIGITVNGSNCCGSSPSVKKGRGKKSKNKVFSVAFAPEGTNLFAAAATAAAVAAGQRHATEDSALNSSGSSSEGCDDDGADSSGPEDESEGLRELDPVLGSDPAPESSSISIPDGPDDGCLGEAHFVRTGRTSLLVPVGTPQNASMAKPLRASTPTRMEAPSTSGSTSAAAAGRESDKISDRTKQPLDEVERLYLFDASAVQEENASNRSLKEHRRSPAAIILKLYEKLNVLSDPLEIKFARAEALHTHGFPREAHRLAVELAWEVMSNPPDLMIDIPAPVVQQMVPPAPTSTSGATPRRKKKRNVEVPVFMHPLAFKISHLASATLKKSSFLCSVLSEDPEHHQLAFQVGLFGLELSRQPAATKFLEVQMNQQESHLVELLKRLPLGVEEMDMLRERAQRFVKGFFMKNLQPVLPYSLASFVFETLNGTLVYQEPSQQARLMSARSASDEELGFEAAVAALGLKFYVSEAEHPLLCEGLRRQRGDLALSLLLRYKDQNDRLALIMDRLLDRDIHTMYRHHASNASFYITYLNTGHGVLFPPKLMEEDESGGLGTSGTTPATQASANGSVGSEAVPLGAGAARPVGLAVDQAGQLRRNMSGTSFVSTLSFEEADSEADALPTPLSLSDRSARGEGMLDPFISESNSSRDEDDTDFAEDGLEDSAASFTPTVVRLADGSRPGAAGHQGLPHSHAAALDVSDYNSESSSGISHCTPHSNSGSFNQQPLAASGVGLCRSGSIPEGVVWNGGSFGGVPSSNGCGPPTSMRPSSLYPGPINFIPGAAPGPSFVAGMGAMNMAHLPPPVHQVAQPSASTSGDGVGGVPAANGAPSAAHSAGPQANSTVAKTTTDPFNKPCFLKLARHRGRYQTPNQPNQPSEATAHFMFELAKTLLTKAGGTHSTAIFSTGAGANQQPNGGAPHRGLHLCAFQIGLYALGLHNKVSSNWLSRTYSSHVSWIAGQAMEIGRVALRILMDTWENHLTPTEVANLADKASQGRDAAMVQAAAELALSSLPHAHALNPTEIQRALVQCREQNVAMLEKACLAVENAAKDGGVYPEVLFMVARQWHVLYLESGGSDDVENLIHHMDAAARYYHPFHQQVFPSYQQAAGVAGVGSGAGGSPHQFYFPGMIFSAGPGLGTPGGSNPAMGHPFLGTPGMGASSLMDLQQHFSRMGLGGSPGIPGLAHNHLANTALPGLNFLPGTPQTGYPNVGNPVGMPGGPLPQGIPLPGMQQQSSVPSHPAASAGVYSTGAPGAGMLAYSGAGVPFQMTTGAQVAGIQPSTSAATAAGMYHPQQPAGAAQSPNTAFPPQLFLTPNGTVASSQMGQFCAPPPTGPPTSAGILGQHSAAPAAPGGFYFSTGTVPNHGAPAISVASVPGSVGNAYPTQLPPGVVPVGATLASQQHSMPAINNNQAGGGLVGAHLGCAAANNANAARLHMSHSSPALGSMPPQNPPTLNQQGMLPPPPHNVNCPPQHGVPQPPPGGPEHPGQNSNCRYLYSAYRVGKLAMETMGRRIHDDNRNYVKYAQNPPYGDDVKWLFKVSKKLGLAYVQQFVVAAAQSVVSPFVLYDLSVDAAHVFARGTTPLAKALLHPNVQPLMQKCLQMFYQASHQKLSHPRFTPSDAEELIALVLAARTAFLQTPGGTDYFNVYFHSLRKQKACKKDLWTRLVNSLSNNGPSAN